MALITRRVIDPLLNASVVDRGARVVDVGADSEDASGSAVERGAIPIGWMVQLRWSRLLRG